MQVRDYAVTVTARKLYSISHNPWADGMRCFSRAGIFFGDLLEREGFFMQNILKKLQEWKKIIAIGLFLVLTFLAGSSGLFKNSPIVHPQVLGAKTHILPIPTPTLTPTIQPVTIINNIYVPTSAPTVLTPTPTSLSTTPTPTPISFQPTATPTPSVLPTVTPLPTSVQATPIPQSIEIDIDYAGEHANSSYTTTIISGETAWQAVQDAIGIANLQYTDYGVDLGIFITGFNSVNAAANQYYDFQINGTSASVGVSSYTVNNNDVLKFVLTSF